MNTYKVNFTTPETSTNSTADSYWLIMDRMDMVFYSIALVLGLPTHFYVIWLIVTKSGVPSEFFNLNLSVCELGSCLNCLLSVLDWFLRLRTLSWFLFGLAITGRPLFQCLMCVERYLAVVHPITFLKYKPFRYKVVCCSVAWIMTLGSCLCCIFTIISQFVFLWFFSAQFLFFLFIQLFCLLAVLRALKHSGPGERKREKEENRMKIRAFYLILITTVSIIIIYVPFSVSGFIVIVKQQIIGELFYVSFICFALGGFVQPVFYLHRTGKVSCLCRL